MIATISADIVHSTSLSIRNWISLRVQLKGLLDDFARDYSGFWSRIVRGDSIECVVPNYKDALRIAIMIKLFVKMQVAKYDCSELLQKYGIRFSIGIDDLEYANKKADIISGSAIYLSGRNLDEISRRDNVYTAFELGRAFQSANEMLDSYVALVSDIVDSYSVKQSEVVFYKLLGYKEVEISERLGIYQSSVNTRSTGAQWNLLNKAINDFEKFDFEKLCG